MNQTKEFILTPGYISGLTQTDGCFSCSISILKEQITFSPSFTITSDLTSKYVLESIQSFFKCGRISVSDRDHSANYVVSWAFGEKKIFLK